MKTIENKLSVLIQRYECLDALPVLTKKIESVTNEDVFFFENEKYSFVARPDCYNSNIYTVYRYNKGTVSGYTSYDVMLSSIIELNESEVKEIALYCQAVIYSSYNFRKPNLLKGESTRQALPKSECINIYVTDIIKVVQAALHTFDYEKEVFNTRLYQSQGGAYCLLLELLNDIKKELVQGKQVAAVVA